MDTLLVNGDHTTDGRGIPIKLDGERELIQRALIRLAVRKGSFALDGELGSELYKLRGMRGGDFARIAQSYAQEALLTMPEVSVTDVAIDWPGADIMRLYVNLSTARGQYQLEVDIN